MASNYPAGAEHDPNAPYNQVDYPPRPHEVELSVTFRLKTGCLEYAEDEAGYISNYIKGQLEKMGKDVIEDVVVEVELVEADYDEDGYGDYEDYDEDFYYFHGED